MSNDILPIILNILDQVGNDRLGRTAIQKIVYFMNEKMNLSINYSAYLYGPFSEEVSEAIDLLSTFGYIETKVEKNDNDVEFVSYKYSINENGKKYLNGKDRIGTEVISQIYEDYNTILHKNLKYLSYASKYHYLEKYYPLEGKPVTEREDIINRYKWEIPPQATDDILEFLSSIGVRI